MAWTNINWVVDGLFLLDIILIFNTAILNEEYQIIEDRCAIAKDYLSFWFWIDIIAIIPFDILVN